MKKFLAFVLSLAMLLSLVIVPVWAEEPEGENKGPLVGEGRYPNLFNPDTQVTETLDSESYNSAESGITANQLWESGTTRITDQKGKNLYFGKGSTKDNPTIVWIRGAVTVEPKIQIPYGLNESDNAFVIFVGLGDGAKLILQGGMTLVTQDGKEAQDNSQPFVAFAGNLELVASDPKRNPIKVNYVVMADGATLKIDNNIYTDAEDEDCTFLDINTESWTPAARLRTTSGTAPYSMKLATGGQIRYESVQVENDSGPYGGTKNRVITNTGNEDITIKRLPENDNGEVTVEASQSVEITSREGTIKFQVSDGGPAKIRFARRYMWVEEGTVTIAKNIARRELQVQVHNVVDSEGKDSLKDSKRVFVSFTGKNNTDSNNTDSITLTAGTDAIKAEMVVPDGSTVALEKGTSADNNAVAHVSSSGLYTTTGVTTLHFDADANMYVMSGKASFGVQSAEPTENTGSIFGGGTGAKITNDATNASGTTVTVQGNSEGKIDVVTVPKDAAITVNERDKGVDGAGADKKYSNPSGGDISITLSNAKSPELSNGDSVSLDSQNTDIYVNGIYVVNDGKTGSVEVVAASGDAPVEVKVDETEVAKITLDSGKQVIIDGITYTGEENGTVITVTGAKGSVYAVANSALEATAGEAFASGAELQGTNQNRVSITSGKVKVSFAAVNQTIRLTGTFTATDGKTGKDVTGSGYLQAGHKNVTATITNTAEKVTVTGSPGLKALYGKEASPSDLAVMEEKPLTGLLITKPVQTHTITVTVTKGTASWAGQENGLASGTITVEDGGSTTINFAPDIGCVLESVTVDGTSGQLTDGKYTFENVTEDHSIEVVYSLDTGDGNEGSYAYTVNYYFDGTLDSALTVNASGAPGAAIPYDRSAKTHNDENYAFDRVDFGSGDGKITEDPAKNVVNVYYAKDAIGNGTDGSDTTGKTPDGIPDKYQITVTFKVQNGYWGEVDAASSDGADKVVVLTRKDGENYSESAAVHLSAEDIPVVGNNPANNYTAGSWDKTPDTETDITSNEIYTYTYTARSGSSGSNPAGGRPGGGTSGGGTSGKPSSSDTTPKPPALNTADHFAYIIGDGTLGPDGLPMVRPEDAITRAEVATIFFRLLTDEIRSQYWSTTNSYPDVAQDDWFNNAISTLSRMGILNGKPDGNFCPNDSITRAELTKIAVLFFEYEHEDRESRFSDIKGHWAEDYITAAEKFGFINGYPDGTFCPDAPIQRSETMAIINRVLSRKPHKDRLYDGMTVWSDNLDTSAWYYADVQEATNSHEYDPSESVETWTGLTAPRNWSELEKIWSNANSGKS